MRPRVLIWTLAAAVLLLGACRAEQAPDPGDPGAPGSSAASAQPSVPQPPPPAGSGGPLTPTPVATPGSAASEETLSIEEPVPVESPKQASGIEVRVAELTAITTTAHIPGEVAGPGLAVRIELVNLSADPIEIDSLVVTLYDSTGAPAGMITSDSDQPRATLQPGETLSGIFRYTIVNDLRDPVTIEVSLPNHPTLLAFQGGAPQTTP